VGISRKGVLEHAVGKEIVFTNAVWKYHIERAAGRIFEDEV